MGVYKRSVTIVSLLCMVVCFAAVAHCKTVYVSAATGKETNDGLTWATAKAKVATGLSLAVASDEVWVAGGNYAERITLKSGAGLYGGFAGGETARDQRNAKTNVTTLDGGQYGTVVTCPSSADANTVIDGFVIRNGNGSTGGGINCGSSSYLTISNNVIIGNTSTYQGGGIYCAGGAPRIINNVIRSNNASSRGGGIFVGPSCLATISNNVIASNCGSSGAGISYYKAITATGNTIVGNSGWGIYGTISSSSPPSAISNNLIAFNADGVGVLAAVAPTLMTNNCVYNPDGRNYVSLSAGTGDISVDPKLAGWQYGNFHIEPDSPCRNAGSNDAPEVYGVDMDGQARVQPVGGTVDIGADESDGTVWATTILIVRVSPEGSDTNDGSSWTLAKRTVQAGINAAAASGGEVWVARGTYSERITLKTGACVFGGFAGTETTRDARDWKANETVLDGGAGGSVVTATGIGLSLAAIDGFTIRNGIASSGGGIYCDNSGVIIANNKITGNTATSLGGAIYCRNFNASAIICNNMITANSAVSGSGIYSDNSATKIRNNVLSANVSLNAFSWGSGGNVFYTGTYVPTILNNTITGGNDFGINCASSTPAAISNNIIAFNYMAMCSSGSTLPTRKNNCFWGSTDVYPGVDDICADPKLAGWQCGDFHIQPDSPCRDAGWNGAVGLGGTDIDGQARVQPAAGRVDIGADESDGTWWTVNAAVVRVSPDGDDANDGSSWALAKKTVQAGMDSAMTVGGEVWMKAGVYTECIKPNATVVGTNGQAGFAYLYGGFAGTETSRRDRDWKANKTILDGNAQGSVVTTHNTKRYLAAVDGFTIRNGKADYGGGVYCSGPTTLANNTIVGNSALQLGGGIYTYAPYYSPGTTTMMNNKIAFNTAKYGGGVACADRDPMFLNNAIARNTATALGGGIYIKPDDSAVRVTISNNCIVGNEGIGICFAEPTSYNGPTTTVITNNSIIANNGTAIQSDSHYSTALSNNIIAFNANGLDDSSRNLMYDGMVLRNNCFYNPSGYETVSSPAGEGDIRGVDPKLADGWWAGDFKVHIQPNSVCRDAGWSGANAIATNDIDGQARTYPAGGVVDIGADEFDGTNWTWVPGSAVVRVKPGGDDRNDGSSWALAKKTVQAGIEEASLTGGEVWVSAGTYTEVVSLRQYVSVYGGFAGTEATRDQRNWSVNKSVLSSPKSGFNTVTAANLAQWPAALDGFTIRNSSSISSIGVCCKYASPTISNNTITGGIPNGIYCSSSSPTISNNVISGNGRYGGSWDNSGIYCFKSSPTIVNNLISANYIDAISLNASSAPVISGNVIKGSSSGIYSSSSSATITNNTIVENGHGVGGSAMAISNNVIAFNTYGVWAGTGCTLRNNNVYSPGGTSYYGITPGMGDISGDPLFVDRAHGNYHLGENSPCVDVGWNGAPGVPALDMDGQTRIHDMTVDMGADEWWPCIADAKNSSGVSIGLSGLAVTAAFPDFFYVESLDRAMGIRVEKASHGQGVGVKVDVEGSLSTNLDGERFISAGKVSPIGAANLAPVMVTNKSLGGGRCGLQSAVWNWLTTRQPDDTLLRTQTEGSGLNNIGLLIKTTGKVTYATDGYFYIDDGSGLDDNSGHRGVKVYGRLPLDPRLDPVNKNVTVIGISSCEKPGTDPVRVIRTRSEGDVVVMGAPLP